MIDTFCELPRIIDNGNVFDPFVWLETESDESLAWLSRQATQTSQVLLSLPGDQTDLAARIRRALSIESRTVPLGRNGRYLFLCSPPGAERASLWLAKAPGETGHEILHPAILDQAEGMAEICDIWPSPDACHAVLAVTHGGRQSTQLVVISLPKTGSAIVLERLDTPSFAWAGWHDDGSFFWSHRVDDAQVLALRTIGCGTVPVAIPCDTTGAGAVPMVSEDGAWLVLLLYSPGIPGCRLFAAINSPTPDFCEISGFDSENLALAGWWQEGLVLVPCSGAGRDVVLADLTPLVNGDAPVLRPLYRDDTGRMSNACALPDGDLLLIDRADDGGNAFRHWRRDGRVDNIKADSGITWNDWTIDRDNGTVIANITRWDTPSHLVAYVPAAKSFRSLRPAPIGLTVWTGQDWAVAEDGTRIPVTLLKPVGMEKDRDLPCLLWGYGGFGLSMQPRCMMSMEPWLTAGGMIAIAHVRGGGELGPAWHKAGKGINKLNSFTDFITVARWLATSGHTSARRLCLWGASAGGLLVLGSALLAPDCCAAVMADNPVTDMAKFTRYPDDGRYWTIEFGDPDNDPEARAAIARWSPLHILEPGRAYPASLITIAHNDERVSPVHGRKMTAALQATGANGLHLLWEQGGVGHGGHTTVTDSANSSATLLLFAAWKTGLEWGLVSDKTSPA